MIFSRIPEAVFALALATTTAQADMLEVQNVTDDVYALVGPKEQRSAENLANNATFGVVVTDEGVVLMVLFKNGTNRIRSNQCRNPCGGFGTFVGTNPAFYSASFSDTQLRIDGAHIDSSRQITTGTFN